MILRTKKLQIPLPDIYQPVSKMKMAEQPELSCPMF